MSETCANGLRPMNRNCALCGGHCDGAEPLLPPIGFGVVVVGIRRGVPF